MSDRLVYGHIFMFETDLPLQYRIIVPVVFKGIQLPDDYKTAVRQVNMYTKLPEVVRIIDHKTVANWDRDKDDIVIQPKTRRHKAVPEYDVLMYSFTGERFKDTGDRKQDVTFKDVPSLREYISKHHNFKIDGTIYRTGLTFQHFIIRESVLDSGDLDTIRAEVKQSSEKWYETLYPTRKR